MLGQLRSSMTYANVASSIALFVAVGTGGAYAADTIGSTDIIDEAILSQDIKDGEVKSSELGLDSVVSTRIHNGSVLNADLATNAVTSLKVLDNDLVAADLNSNSVGQGELQQDAVGAPEIQDQAVGSAAVVDFGLSNQDIGVLFAEVSATSIVNNSSGGVTATKLTGVAAGIYEVDFGRDIHLCTAVATIGPSGSSAAAGQINVADRANNDEAVLVRTNDGAGLAADRPFRLVVVC